MIWFMLLLLVGVIICFITDMSEKISGIMYDVLMLCGKCISALGVILFLASFVVSSSIPTGYESTTVLIISENGVIEEVEDKYYKNESGEFFVLEDKNLKGLIVPFYKDKMIKTDIPVFEKENFASEKMIVCDECNALISEKDAFCSKCGEKLNKKGK